MDGTAGQEVQTQEQTPKIEPREVVVGRTEEAPAAGLEEEKPASQAKEIEKEPGGRTKTMQDRIDEITRARREAEREAEYWRQRAGAGAPVKKDPDARPNRDQFQSDEHYQEALVDWKVDQKLKVQEQKQSAQRQASEKSQSWNTKQASAREEIPDYSEVVDASELPVAGHVGELLMEHEHGAKVVYDLAKNPELLDKLNEMSPARAAFEIAKMAAKHDKPATPPVPSPKPAAVSKAPPPPKANVGAGRSTAPSLDEMSHDEYREFRRKQGANWAR